MARPARATLARPRCSSRSGAGGAQRFRDIISSEDELRALVGHAPQRSVDKVVHVIDDYGRRFIAHSPFLFIASAGAGGMLDISPKGDPAGFVKVLDERTLGIPNRLGNRRLDTLRNILQNPNVGLTFLIRGISYTLRVSGKAIIVRDLELREQMAINGKLPDHALVVDVEHVLTHCRKCMIRSGLWEPDEAGHERPADLRRNADRPCQAR